MAAQLVNLDLANRPKVSAKPWKLQRVLALDVKVRVCTGDWLWVGELSGGAAKGEGTTAHTNAS